MGPGSGDPYRRPAAGRSDQTDQRCGPLPHGRNAQGGVTSAAGVRRPQVEGVDHDRGSALGEPPDQDGEQGAQQVGQRHPPGERLDRLTSSPCRRGRRGPLPCRAGRTSRAAHPARRARRVPAGPSAPATGGPASRRRRPRRPVPAGPGCREGRRRPRCGRAWHRPSPARWPRRCAPPRAARARTPPSWIKHGSPLAAVRANLSASGRPAPAGRQRWTPGAGRG